MRRAWARQPKPAASLNYHNDFMDFFCCFPCESPRAPACAAPQHSPPIKFLPACSLIISCTFFRFSHEKPFRGLEHDSSPTVSERNLETKMGKRERERETERGEREREGSARRQRDLVWVDLLSAAHLLCSLENCRIVSQAHQTLLMPMPQPAPAPRREKKKGWSCSTERGRERARQGGSRAKNASGASSPSSLSHPRPRTRLGGEGGERKREREREAGVVVVGGRKTHPCS